MSDGGVSRGTVCGSGISLSTSAAEAITEALGQARATLGDTAPELGLVFAAPTLPLAELLAAARALYPGVDFVACTSAGEITERGLTHGGVAAMLIAWADARHSIRISTEPTSDAGALVQELCPETEPTAACLLFGDGLSPMLEKLVEQLRRNPRHKYPVAGAGAADERDFEKTLVGFNETCGAGAMSAIMIESRRKWGIGVAHGLHPVTPRMTVTKARGNIVTEIDDRPGLDVYRDFAKSRGIVLDAENTLQFLVEHELGVLLFQDVVRVRAPIRIVRDDELFFAGVVPEGSSVCIVHGEHDEIIQAARFAAAEAKLNLGSSSAAGVLVFSCVCRAMVLGERYADEIAAIRTIFPGVPLVGFSSYGEVAHSDNKLDGYHNNTIVVAAIPR